MSTHSPGAVRAAKQIVEAVQDMFPEYVLRVSKMIDKTAAVIDAETASKEMAEAAKLLMMAFEGADHVRCYVGPVADRVVNLVGLKMAIAKLEGRA